MPSEEWALPAEPSSVPQLRSRVVDYATEHDVPAEQVSELALGASEALTNAVQHAFAPGAPGSISACVSVEREHGHVLLAISDDGVGMTLRPDSPGFGPGLALISRTAKDFSVQPGARGAGTTVRMTFAVPAWAPEPDPGDPEPAAVAAPPAAAPDRKRSESSVVIFVSLALAAWAGVAYALVRLL